VRCWEFCFIYFFLNLRLNLKTLSCFATNLTPVHERCVFTYSHHFRFQSLHEGTLGRDVQQRYFVRLFCDSTRGALFEVIRKVACAQISNMRMVL
jgi:hypothetical protein